MGSKEKIYWILDPETGCHVCISHICHKEKGKNLYPRLWRNGKRTNMMRALWEDKHGPLPDGYEVRHLCHNKRCINMDHLLPGTHAENMRDEKNKPAGMSRSLYAEAENNKAAKLTEEKVKEILSSSETAKALAMKFGVNYDAVWLVRKGKGWYSVRGVALDST